MRHATGSFQVTFQRIPLKENINIAYKTYNLKLLILWKKNLIRRWPCAFSSLSHTVRCTSQTKTPIQIMQEQEIKDALVNGPL